MQVTLCIPTLRRFDTLRTCIESSLQGDIVPSKILIIDNSAGQLRQHEFYDLPVYIHTPSSNWGCARSWNWFMGQNEDMIVIANDDIIFNTKTIASLVEAYEEDPYRFFAPCAGSNIFSCFLLPKQVFNAVHAFDQQFWPAYFEDDDYTKRINQAGIPFCFTGAGYGHVGSATLASYTPEEMSLHHQQFNMNRERFITKWGALP